MKTERTDILIIGAEIAAERGSILVPPFDDPFVIEGQGTVGLEMLEQAGIEMDQLLCGACLLYTSRCV